MTSADTLTTLQLPMLPPTVNHMYRNTNRGGKVLTDEAQTFRQEVALAMRGQSAPDGLLACTVQLTFGRRKGRTRRLDADNRIKALADAVALALGFDDSRIVEWHVYSAHGAADEVRAALSEVA